MANIATVPAHMQGKALCFVTGHNKPAVAPTSARYVRTHPDGSPMLASGTGDTLADCAARWEAAQSEAAALAAKEAGEGEGGVTLDGGEGGAPKRARGKKGEGAADDAAEGEATDGSLD